MTVAGMQLTTRISAFFLVSVLLGLQSEALTGALIANVTKVRGLFFSEIIFLSDIAIHLSKAA